MIKNKKLFLLVPLLFLLTGCLKPKIVQEAKQEKFSLKDAISLGKSVRCTYKVEDAETTSWVKGEKVRVEGVGVGSAGSGGMINDGEYVYIWGNENKEGMKYKLSAMEQLEGTEGMDVDQWKDTKKWAAEMEDNFQVDCQAVIISDDKFNPPADVEFKDMTEFMEKAKKIQEAVPSTDPHGGINQEEVDQLKDLMDQFSGNE